MINHNNVDEAEQVLAYAGVHVSFAGAFVADPPARARWLRPSGSIRGSRLKRSALVESEVLMHDELVEPPVRQKQGYRTGNGADRRGRVRNGVAKDGNYVPLFVKLPGRAAARVVADRISTIAVMPTILDLLDVDVPEKAKQQRRGASTVVGSSTRTAALLGAPWAAHNP